MNKITIPIVHNRNCGIKLINVEVDVIVNKIFDRMTYMMDDGYQPKYLVMWEGYSSILPGIVARYDRVMNPLAPKTKIDKVLGLEVILTQKTEVLEVY